MTERKMRSVSQRNPADPEHASADVFDRMFQRGPEVAADGGERGAGATQRPDGGEEGADDGEGENRPTADGQKMKDVDQTPPDEEASSNRVWERGGEPPAEDGEADDTDEDEAVADE
jgi:hypothetical protein